MSPREILESTPSANTFDPAIKGDVLGVSVLLLRDVRVDLSRRWRGAFRRAMMRSSNDGLGRAERDQHDCQEHSRNGSHAIRGFSALSLPRFVTMSKDTLAPSASD
jgi:hypothetical protein